jgi:hypothetical protein
MTTYNVRLLVRYLLYGAPGELLILALGRRLSPLCLSRERFPARDSAPGIAEKIFLRQCEKFVWLFYFSEDLVLRYRTCMCAQQALIIRAR